MSHFDTAGKWIQFRELAKTQWHHLSDEEIDLAKDNLDHFIQMTSEKYQLNLEYSRSLINSLLFKIGIV